MLTRQVKQWKTALADRKSKDNKHLQVKLQKNVDSKLQVQLEHDRGKRSRELETRTNCVKTVDKQENKKNNLYKHPQKSHNVLQH